MPRILLAGNFEDADIFGLFSMSIVSFNLIQELFVVHYTLSDVTPLVALRYSTYICILYQQNGEQCRFVKILLVIGKHEL